MTRVVGIDLSLTSTGLADHTGVHRVRSAGRLSDSLVDRHRRIAHIAGAVVEWTGNAKLAVVEAPSIASHGGSKHDRSGLWWMVTSRLLRLDVPVAAVPPTNRAKYATGKGNAAKDVVLAATVRRFPTFDVNGNDIADALILAAMGYDHIGCPLVVMPDSHRDALAKVQWPDLIEAAA